MIRQNKWALHRPYEWGDAASREYERWVDGCDYDCEEEETESAKETKCGKGKNDGRKRT